MYIYIYLNIGDLPWNINKMKDPQTWNQTRFLSFIFWKIGALIIQRLQAAERLETAVDLRDVGGSQGETTRVFFGGVWRWWVVTIPESSQIENWWMEFLKTVLLVVKRLFSRANLLLVEMAVFGSMWFSFLMCELVRNFRNDWILRKILKHGLINMTSILRSQQR